ncbi:hypothetical protein VO01_03050 [Clavibacter michiganensis subsp. insidiosus]|uniref:Uncharacterized protein n=1 Tax=Clavibacter michiganensis subsp. insidiosus TaxID=33014 RepID=A0A0D5CG69_9MICO|nr:hypothetical protein VO01_03050 [Clavibacter michiganensis subsp. insidiosus]
MLVERLVHAEAHGRERADGEGDPVGDEPVDERGILEAAHPVVHPFHAQQIERLVDVGRRPLLARVRDRVQAELTGAREDVDEQRRRVADLGGVEPDGEQLVGATGDGLEGRHRLLHRPVAEEAEDQAARDAVAHARVAERVEEAVEHVVDGDAAGRVRLRVERHLDVPDPVGRGPLQVRGREVVEVAAGAEDRGARVVEVEERLQVGEGVARAEVLDARVRQVDAVALGQLEHQLRFERPLDVQVQLGGGRERGDHPSTVTGARS